nr:Coat protein [Lily mottle virus]
ANETLNAGASSSTQASRSTRPEASIDVAPQQSSEARVRDRDVDAGTVGTYQIPRLKALATKINVPKVKGRMIVNTGHLVNYNPDQTDISNTRSTQKQFEAWYNAVKDEYGLNDESMALAMNGLMVWCIENGTSPNVNGVWLMMDGDQQVEFPLRPILEHAKPTLRQIMAHFSNLAEAYIEKQNLEKPYMPRYGLQRNLTDFNLARFAFDFYEVTSRTPARAKEAHFQMKTAALRGKQSKLFGLDGKVNTQDEDTERHTADDVNKNMHSLLGISM